MRTTKIRIYISIYLVSVFIALNDCQTIGTERPAESLPLQPANLSIQSINSPITGPDIKYIRRFEAAVHEILSAHVPGTVINNELFSGFTNCFDIKDPDGWSAVIDFNTKTKEEADGTWVIDCPVRFNSQKNPFILRVKIMPDKTVAVTFLNSFDERPPIEEPPIQESLPKDGFIRDGKAAWKAFQADIEEIRDYDITDVYRDIMADLIKRAEELLPPGKLDELKKYLNDYRIYGFLSYIEGENDFVLGAHDVKQHEIFLAMDVLSALSKKGDLSRPLIEEYLLHEILCPLLGHKAAIDLQEMMFSAHYPASLKIDGVRNKGMLGRVLRDEIITRFLASESDVLSREEVMRAQPSQQEMVIDALISNRRAIRQGLISIDEIIRVSKGGREEAVRLLRAKSAVSIRSWSQILWLIEIYPDIVERIIIDLDDTLFTTKGYVGSEAWFRDEMDMYRKPSAKLHAEKLNEEIRLIECGFFMPVERDIIARLSALKKKHPEIEIMGLTARDPHYREEATKRILRAIGADMPVIYAGSFGKKREALMSALNARDNEITAENGKRLREKRAELESKIKRVSGEMVIDQTELVAKKLWLYIDDQADKIIRPKLASALDDRDVLVYQYDRGKEYYYRKSITAFGRTVLTNDKKQAAAHLVDAFALLKFEDDAARRASVYLDENITNFIQTSGDYRLKAAYTESMIDFLNRGLDMNIPEPGRSRILNACFSYAAPMNAKHWVRAYKEGLARFDKVGTHPGSTRIEGNYELRVSPDTIYLFLEPFLKYIKNHNPNVVILPDTGARPFKELVDHFIREEGLSTKTIIFPVSRNVAGDTMYEIRRWMRLVKGELTPNGPEDTELAERLSELRLNVLSENQSVVILDDNVTTGDTVDMIAQVLADEHKIGSLIVFTPFAYKNPDQYFWPCVSTMRIYGSYAWRGGGKEAAPPYVAGTDWEGWKDSEYKGARTRKRFTYPPNEHVDTEAGREYRAKLLKGFIDQYVLHKTELNGVLSGNENPIPVKEQNPSQNIKLNSGALFLGDEIKLTGNNISLVSIHGTLPDWAILQNAVTFDDKVYIREKNVYVYDIRDEKEESSGLLILAMVKEEGSGDNRLIIRKIQPRMEKERSFDPVGIVEGIKSCVERFGKGGVEALCMDTDKWTMSAVSESHWVRYVLHKKYSFLPRAGGLTLLNGSQRPWIGESNYIWRNLNAEDIRVRDTARENITEIKAHLKSKGFRGILLRRLFGPYRHDMNRVVKLLDMNLPVEDEESILMGSLKGFAEACPDTAIKAKKNKELIYYEMKTGLLCRILWDRYNSLGIEMRFPDGYFDPSDNKLRTIRIRSAFKYFLNNVYQGNDITALTREELSEWGLWNIFPNKGALLEYLAPTCYVLSKGRGYVRNHDAVNLQWESVERFLSGEWYAVADGMKYSITGTEINPYGSQAMKGLWQEYTGKDIIFKRDINYRVTGEVQGGKDNRTEIVCDYGKGMRCLNRFSKPGSQWKDLGWLDVMNWRRGRDVRVRPNETSRIIVKRLLDEGRVLPLSLSVHTGWAGKSVVGILREDINHGVVLEWFPYDEETGARGTELLNMHYFQDGVLRSLYAGTFGRYRNIGWLDILKWARGGKVTPRPDGSSSWVSPIDEHGIIPVLVNDKNMRFGRFLTAGKEYAKRITHAQCVLKEDINHGTLVEVYEYDMVAGTSVGAPININWFNKGRLRSLYGAKTAELNRGLGWLDLIKWLKQEPVIPRPDGQSRYIANVGRGGEVVVKAGMPGLQHGGMITVGKSLKGERVVGILTDDINHGVILQWYKYDAEHDGPIGELLNAHYFYKGKLRILQNDRVKVKRTLGYLDIAAFFMGEKVEPRPMQASYYIPPTIQSDSGVIKPHMIGAAERNADVHLGEEILSKKGVMGILENDLNHGVVLNWYGYDPETNVREQEPFNTHYYYRGRLNLLYKTGDNPKTLGWLDILRWVRNEEVKPRDKEKSCFIIPSLREDGCVFISSKKGKALGERFYIGAKYAGKPVIGILKQDQNHGVVLMWYEYDPETSKRKADFLNMHYIRDKKLYAIMKTRSSDRNMGWLDIVKWMRGETVIPRENNDSSFLLKPAKNCVVCVKSDKALYRKGKLYVGTTDWVRGVLDYADKNDHSRGLALRWYKAKEGSDQVEGEPIRVHMVVNDDIKDVADEMTFDTAKATPIQDIRLLQGLPETEAVMKNTIDSVYSAIHSRRTVVLAFNRRLSGYNQKIKQIIESELERWKAKSGRQSGHLSKVLERFTILDYEDARDLDNQLSGINGILDRADAKANLVLAFSPENESKGLTTLGACVRPVGISEDEKFSKEAYYPLMEMVLISLVKEHIEYGSGAKCCIEDIIKGLGIDLKGVNILNIDDSEKQAFIKFILSPITKMDHSERVSRYERMIRFLRAA